jgi:26S proteasome non-ATPase regulatory subunit 10
MIASSLKDTSTSDPLIDLLLAKNADPTLTTSTGATALHFAASKSNLDTAKKLLEHKASARVKDKRGQLPLHRAAAVGNVPMVKLLLQSRSPVNASDGDGCTALHHAIAEGHGDAAVVLLKAGAETDKKDTSGALALDLAPDAKVSLTVSSIVFDRRGTDFVVGQRVHYEGCRGGRDHTIDGYPYQRTSPPSVRRGKLKGSFHFTLQTSPGFLSIYHHPHTAQSPPSSIPPSCSHHPLPHSSSNP